MAKYGGSNECRFCGVSFHRVRAKEMHEKETHPVKNSIVG